METALIILAAGQGSRMNSDLPKVLHRIAGAPLVAHAMRAGAAIDPSKTVVITGHGAGAVEQAVAAFDPEAVCLRQESRDGTAHAVDQARDILSEFSGDVIVLYADTPFIRPETLEQMQSARRDGADLVILGFEADDPGRYGRLIVKDGALERIVEAKDASAEELAVTLCNSGVVCASRETLFSLISEVGNDNESGEYYLTDIVGLARARGLTAIATTCPEAEVLGINTRAELASAEENFQARARAAALEDGVSLAQPETTYFSYDTVIGRDASIGPNVVFGPGVTIESGAHIDAFCHLEGCHVARDARVGPFARLRPGAELSEAARVGNFVEIKNATLGEGAKVNHLTYIGDADIGEAANIGAGTVTCNYDGVMKHRTKIGARAFVGSGSMLVAPVEIGVEAMTGSGSVITQDIGDGDLGLARARQENKQGFARRLMEMLRAKKAKRYQ